MDRNISLTYEIADKLSESDLEKINQMIISIWDYHAWIPKNHVIPMAEFFLAEVIITSSRIFVVRDHNEIVGVIAASITNNLRQKANAKIKKYRALQKIILDKKQHVFESYIDTLILNEKLLLDSQKDFTASLNLFILDERYQGLGIGSKLYSIFTEYLIDHKIQTFFLFTDNSSNFLFYERKGLKRIAEEKYSWNDSTESTELYYLYEGKIE